MHLQDWDTQIMNKVPKYLSAKQPKIYQGMC